MEVLEVTEQRMPDAAEGATRTFDGGSKTIPNSLADVTDFGFEFDAEGVSKVLFDSESAGWLFVMTGMDWGAWSPLGSEDDGRPEAGADEPEAGDEDAAGLLAGVWPMESPPSLF